MDDILSIRELRERLMRVRIECSHLVQKLPADSPHNAVLRLHDIARYIPMREHDLRTVTIGAKYLRFKESWQRDLSRFFWAWDRGNITKARVGDEWKIVSTARDASLAQMAATKAASLPQRKPIAMKIDLTTLGPKLTVKR